MQDVAELLDQRELAALAADPRPGTNPLADTALGVFGIELLEVASDHAVLRMPARWARERSTLLVLAESAASTAAGTAAGPEHRAFGAELDAALLGVPGPDDDDPVLARATPLSLSEERQTWRVVVVDCRGAALLEGRCTLGVVPAPAAAAAR